MLRVSKLYSTGAIRTNLLSTNASQRVGAVIKVRFPLFYSFSFTPTQFFYSCSVVKAQLPQKKKSRALF